MRDEGDKRDDTTAAGLGCFPPRGRKEQGPGRLGAYVQGRLVTSCCPLLQERGGLMLGCSSVAREELSPGLQPWGQIPVVQSTAPPSFQGTLRDLMSEGHTRIRALKHIFWGRDSSFVSSHLPLNMEQCPVFHRPLAGPKAWNLAPISVTALDAAWLFHLLPSAPQVKATWNLDRKMMSSPFTSSLLSFLSSMPQ